MEQRKEISLITTTLGFHMCWYFKVSIGGSVGHASCAPLFVLPKCFFVLPPPTSVTITTQHGRAIRPRQPDPVESRSRDSEYHLRQCVRQLRSATRHQRSPAFSERHQHRPDQDFPPDVLRSKESVLSQDHIHFPRLGCRCGVAIQATCKHNSRHWPSPSQSPVWPDFGGLYWLFHPDEHFYQVRIRWGGSMLEDINAKLATSTGQQLPPGAIQITIKASSGALIWVQVREDAI